jgi:hypothetical protein
MYLGSSSELDVIKTAAFGALIPSLLDPASKQASLNLQQKFGEHFTNCWVINHDNPCCF